jgi:hypothetical protein
MSVASEITNTGNDKILDVLAQSESEDEEYMLK